MTPKAGLRIAAVVAALLCVGIAPAAAQEREQVVYWPLVTDGGGYRRVAYPPQAGPLLVVADTEVVLEPRRAPVTYWPITREYLADMARSAVIDGAELEIIGRSGSAEAVARQPYIVWHPEGVGSGPAQLARGKKAIALYEEYLQKARASAEEVQRFQLLVAEHQASLEAWLRLAGERRGENMPDPPPALNLQAPEPYRAYATEPAEGYVLSLPAGNYRIRLRAQDGGIVEESERELVSFEALGRGIGYRIRPQDRWTQPLVSFAPDETIYTTGGADLFFEPIAVAEYEAGRFMRLFRPQSVEVTDPSLTIWVPAPGEAGKQTGASLSLWKDDRRLASVPPTGFRIVQAPGASRGYTIEEFENRPDASLEPDFTAMRVAIGSGVTKVSLTGAQGEELSGSDRRVRKVEPPPKPLLFAPALLVLAVAGAVRVAWTGRARRA